MCLSGYMKNELAVSTIDYKMAADRMETVISLTNWSKDLRIRLADTKLSMFSTNPS